MRALTAWLCPTCGRTNWTRHDATAVVCGGGWTADRRPLHPFAWNHRSGHPTWTGPGMPSFRGVQLVRPWELQPRSGPPPADEGAAPPRDPSEPRLASGHPSPGPGPQTIIGALLRRLFRR